MKKFEVLQVSHPTAQLSMSHNDNESSPFIFTYMSLSRTTSLWYQMLQSHNQGLYKEVPWQNKTAIQRGKVSIMPPLAERR